MTHRITGGHYMYGALPKNERTFSINIEGNVTGEKFEGQFTAKCVLNLAEKHAKELEKTRLLADNSHPSDGLAGIAEFLSTIRSKLTAWPDWWANLDHGSKIIDENIIVHLYDELIRIEHAWRDEVKKKAEESKSPNKEPQPGNA